MSQTVSDTTTSTTTTTPAAPTTPHGSAPPDDAAAWVRVTRLGAGLVAVWGAALTAVAGVIPPVVGIGAVFGVLALVLAPHRRRLAVTTGVLAVVAVVGGGPGMVDSLTHPSSGVAFSFDLFALLACVIGVAGGLGVLRGWGTGGIRPLLATVTLAFVAGLVLAVVASVGADSTGPLDGDVQVTAEHGVFSPDRVRVEAGTTGLWLDNRDGIRHTLTLEGTDTELEVAGYRSGRVEVDLAPGTYGLICTVPGHESMRVELEVTS